MHNNKHIFVCGLVIVFCAAIGAVTGVWLGNNPEIMCKAAISPEDCLGLNKKTGRMVRHGYEK